MSGKVYLVGAGPGDRGLITARALECLRRADVVLYDALANEALLDVVPVGAERLFVGKRRGRPTMDQEGIERILVDRARAGKIVVRLKGGDPFVFGRGGEEGEACWHAGVSFEIVPGVTSAIAVPAYAGIPLTHRDHASAVTFVTGRPGDGEAGADPDWRALVRLGGTIVFLMAFVRTGEIVEELIHAGIDPSTPAAAIRWGTTPRQQTISGTVADIASRMQAATLTPPGILVIGAVAALREKLRWYEDLPLFGRRIVVTRARRQADTFSRTLERLGAEVVEYPTIEVLDPEDSGPLRAALADLPSYDWLVLTSVNGVERFFAALVRDGHDVRELAGVRIAAIGSATAAAVGARGMKVAATPAEFRAEALLESLGDVAGRRILLARALVAREILPDELRRRGARVDVVAVYRTELPRRPRAVADLGGSDMVTFTSSSTVTNFLQLGGNEARELLQAGATAVIGPITAATLQKAGFPVDVMPAQYTVPALTEAILDFFAKRERSQ